MPTSDQEAINALLFRQPNGSAEYGKFATHVYQLLREARKLKIDLAYINAVNLANSVFGFTAEPEESEANGSGNCLGSESNDDACDCPGCCAEAASAANSAKSPSQASQSDNGRNGIQSDRMNLVGFVLSSAKDYSGILLANAARDQDKMIGRDLPDPDDIAEYSIDLAYRLASGIVKRGD